MSEKLSNVNPRVYYQSLSKKDKGRFLDYLLVHYGMKTNTIGRKLSKNAYGELTRLEELAITQVIRDNLWRQ